MTASIAKKKANAVALTVAAVCAVVVLGLYLGFVFFYHTHFFQGTIINGIDMSNMSASEAKEALAKASGDYTLTITARDGSTRVLSAGDANRVYVDDKAIDQELAFQNAFAWIPETMRLSSEHLEESAAFDTEAVLRQVKALETVAEATEVAPKNARLEQGEDGLYTIVPEVEGDYIDSAKLEQAVLDAVATSRTSLDLDKADVYVEPAVRSDDPSLSERRDALNKYLACNITVDFGDVDEVLDGHTILPLLTGEGSNVSLSHDAVDALVQKWCETYSTLDYNFMIRNHAGEQKMVEAGGSYGWRLNKAEMVSAVINALENGAQGSIEPIWEVTQDWGRANNGLGDTYVEIDISNQHLWAFRDGECVLDTAVVTGTNNAERRTVNGAYYVQTKFRDIVLGDLKTKGYESHVDYWMGFCGGQGMHDASWRYYFGGDIWLNDGSHGCVNIPVDVMPTLYSLVDQYEPVVLYY